ncbi:MAG: class I SAM-dependent methyltransferase, partial [Lysobacteraceae bacterium]
MSRPPEPQFDRFAHSYADLHRRSIRLSGEAPDYFAAYKVDYLAAHLPGAVDGLRVLDFGCGVGGTLPHLRRRFPGARLHGVDVSEESLAVAREANPGAEFAHIDASRIHLNDAAVDVAIAACVFHHIAPAERGHWIG